MIADCERGLGRPERALALASSPEASTLDRAGKVELLIVAAGARRDLGQPEAAVLTLQVPALKSRAQGEWLARLRYAYADALLEVGRVGEAREWFVRAAEVDPEGSTDAAERVSELDGITFDELEEVDEAEWRPTSPVGRAGRGADPTDGAARRVGGQGSRARTAMVGEPYPGLAAGDGADGAVSAALRLVGGPAGGSSTMWRCSTSTASCTSAPGPWPMRLRRWMPPSTEHGMRSAFVTNNAARTPADVAAHLVDLGVRAEPSDVVTSAQAGARMLAERLPVGSHVLVIGGPGVGAALRERGLVPVESVDDGAVA